MTAAGELLARGPMLLLGATALLATGAAAVLLARSPIHRQRLAEMTVAAVLVWAALACIPLPRWAVTPDSLRHATPDPTIAADPTTSRPVAFDSDLPADWRSALATLIRPPREPAGTPPRPLAATRRDNVQSTAPATANFPGVEPRRLRPVAPGVVAAMLYLIGAGLCAAWLLLGHALLWRIIRRARDPEPWLLAMFDDACRAIGVRRARVLVVAAPIRPVSCGLLRPTVLLGPEDCSAANRPRLKQVLLHEAAHLRQRDAWGNALFNLAMPLLYAHPLYWLLRSKASLAREMIADDLAAAATSRAAYAADLLELARARVGFRAAPLTAVGIFRSPSHFYRRIHMLMQRNTRLHSRCSWPWKLTTSAACGAVLAAACATLGVGQVKAQGTAAVPVETNQNAVDKAVLQAKLALDQAIAQRDSFLKTAKAGAIATEDLKELNSMIAQLEAERDVAKERYGTNSEQFKECQIRLQALKASLRENQAQMLTATKAQLDAQVALAQKELAAAESGGQVKAGSAADGAARSAAKDQNDQPTTREQRAIVRRAELQAMQAREERDNLEGKLKWSEADLAKLQAQLAKLQQELYAATAREQAARAAADLAQQSVRSQQADANKLDYRGAIDRMILERLKKAQVQRDQSNQVNDEIRQGYIDVLGRLPTVDDWTATKAFVQAGLEPQQSNTTGKPSGATGSPAPELSAAVGGLRPELDLVALANSYADAMGNVTVARQELEATAGSGHAPAAKAKLAAAEQKARLFQQITQAALAQAEQELQLAQKRYKAGLAEAGGAGEAEGRVRILSLILNSANEPRQEPKAP